MATAHVYAKVGSRQTRAFACILQRMRERREADSAATHLRAQVYKEVIFFEENHTFHLYLGSKGALLMKGPENLDVSTAIHSTTAMNQRDSWVLSRRSMLSILAVAAAAQPAGNDECGDLVLAAGRELNAFVAAVNESYGRDAALRAQGYWLTVLEDMELLPGSGAMSFRSVTEQAAGRLAKDVLGI